MVINFLQMTMYLGELMPMYLVHVNVTKLKEYIYIQSIGNYIYVCIII